MTAWEKRLLGICIHEDCEKPIENKDTGECSSHGRLSRKLEEMVDKVRESPKAIKKVSDKLKKLQAIYHVRRAKWIVGKMCVVYSDQKATTVHHSAGRSPDAYYDEWARERDIPLLLDERLWIPCSLEGHQYIEAHPEWAKRKGFSEDRLTKTK